MAVPHLANQKTSVNVNTSIFLSVGEVLFWTFHFLQVSAGRGHSLAMARRGALFAFGNGEQGQLGLGIVTNESSPMEVSGLPQLPLLYVLAGKLHSKPQNPVCCKLSLVNLKLSLSF